MAYDEKTAERVRNLLSARTDVVERKMMGGLCFMVKGRMCCSVSGRGGLLVRVGPDAHPSMLGEPHVQPMEMRGRTMAGFLRIAPEGYRTEAGLKKWVKRGVDFVATMPSAPPARKATRPKLQKPQRVRARA
jgi:TfoX/Sxy family transcriptional regulator of competence genes